MAQPEMTASAEAEGKPGAIARFLSPYRRPEMVAMLVLGFASGLPLYLFYSKTSIWLREMGIERSTIGFFYWIGLAYTLKWIWAPIIDKVRVPNLTNAVGHRRSWMIVSITGTVLGLILLSGADPTSGLGMVLIGAGLVAFSGATLDVSIDAWRIESAPTDQQANMAAAYSLGYRGALITSNFGLVIAGTTSWGISFLTMAAAMAICAALVLKMKEPPRPAGATLASTDSFAKRAYRLFAEPFSQVAKRYGTLLIPIVLLVLIYRTSDFTMGVMAGPLYIDLGYATEVIGAIQTGPGVLAIFIGLFLGGAIANWIGVLPSLIVGAILTLVTNGAYAWFAAVAPTDGSNLLALTAAICADNIAGGFVTTVFIAYLSGLVDPANAATQYALFSSLYAFVNKFVAGFSGLMVDTVGYVWFFLITSSYAIPAGLLVIVLMRMQKRRGSVVSDDT